MAYYIYEFSGLKFANSIGDGTSVYLEWFTAYPSISTNKVAYTIYFSNKLENLYFEGIKYFYNGQNTNITLSGFNAGDLMYFAIRAYEYNNNFNFNNLVEVQPNLYSLPMSLLSSNIGIIDTTIPLMDTSEFPNSGVILLGSELIQYTSKTSSALICGSSSINNTGGKIIEYIPGTQEVIFTGSNIDYSQVNPSQSMIVISNATNSSNNGEFIVSNVYPQTSPINDGTIYGFDSATNKVTFASVNLNYSNLIIGQQITISNSINAGNNGTFTITDIQSGGIKYINPAAISPDNNLTYVINGKIGYTNPNAIFPEPETNLTWTLIYSSGRGYNNTVIRPHNVDGTDTTIQWLFYRQGASYYVGQDEQNWDKHSVCEIRYDYKKYPNNKDGYRQITKDNFNLDLSNSDNENENFPAYDYAGYHRQDPGMLLEGTCIGSYQGGEMYCQDDETGVGRVLRGVSMQDRNTQRQEMLLRETGLNCVLLQRQITGIVCYCVFMYNENPDPQCPVCTGTGIVHGWVQYFNPRNSDGRIKLRFEPYEDVAKLDEQGIDPEITTNAWGLVVPSIKQRDMIIQYDRYDNETFRYEVLGVTRNNTFHSLMGDQKIKLGRVRKTEPIYKVKIFKNTSTTPTWSTTSDMVQVSPSVNLPTNIENHTHQFRSNEMTKESWHQNTTVSAGHNHQVVFLVNQQNPNGILVVLPILNHTHTIS